MRHYEYNGIKFYDIITDERSRKLLDLIESKCDSNSVSDLEIESALKDAKDAVQSEYSKLSSYGMEGQTRGHICAPFHAAGDVQMIAFPDNEDNLFDCLERVAWTILLYYIGKNYGSGIYATDHQKFYKTQSGMIKQMQNFIASEKSVA